MSVAAWRIRKRVAFMHGLATTRPDVYGKMPYLDAMSDILEIIDEELEAEAERQFTQRITNDPIARVAQETA